MKNKTMIDKRGRLTAYALACGYIEQANSSPGSAGCEVKMSCDHGVFHVWTVKAPHILESFPTVEAARAAFNALAEQRGAKGLS